MYVVIYEIETAPKTVLDKPGRKFMAWDETFPEWEAADKQAKATAKQFKVRCWVGEIPDPPKLEIIKPLNFAPVEKGPVSKVE